VGATVYFSEKVLLRLGYSETVARPAYREIGRAEIFDIAENKTIRGNPDLRMAAAQNLDARLEWFPRAGEILSLSLYKKKIAAPIEQVAIDSSLISYRNSENADVEGIELEWQTSLERLSAHLREFTFGFNYSYILSSVPLTPEEIVNRDLWQDPATDRPLYDQPEFTFNTDLTWDHQASGTLANLSFGIVGRRLVTAGVTTPDEYEEPAPQLNFNLAQKLGKRWKLKFSAKNLLNPVYETTQTWPRYYEPGVVDIPGRTTVLRRYTKGITFGLGLSCEF
jgi:outer membrane receptor protein involved in Fe transport